LADPSPVSLAERGEIRHLEDLQLRLALATPARPAVEAGAEGPAHAGEVANSPEQENEGNRNDGEEQVMGEYRILVKHFVLKMANQATLVDQHVNAEVGSNASSAAMSQVAVAGDEDLGDKEVTTATVGNEGIPDAEGLYAIDAMVYGSGAFFDDDVFQASPAAVEYARLMDDLVALERASREYCARKRS
jgi:hypothetical protein